MIVKGINVMQCMNKCAEMSVCLSFSMNEAKRICMLHNLKRNKAQKSEYVYDKGYVYWELA